jgi:hypothetical protein
MSISNLLRRIAELENENRELRARLGLNVERVKKKENQIIEQQQVDLLKNSVSVIPKPNIHQKYITIDHRVVVRQHQSVEFRQRGRKHNAAGFKRVGGGVGGEDKVILEITLKSQFRQKRHILSFIFPPLQKNNSQFSIFNSDVQTRNNQAL